MLLSAELRFVETGLQFIATPPNVFLPQIKTNPQGMQLFYLGFGIYRHMLYLQTVVEGKGT